MKITLDGTHGTAMAGGDLSTASPHKTSSKPSEVLQWRSTAPLLQGNYPLAQRFPYHLISSLEIPGSMRKELLFAPTELDGLQMAYRLYVLSLDTTKTHQLILDIHYFHTIPERDVLFDGLC